MTDVFKRTIVYWNWYWGNGFILVLFLAAFLYLLIFHRKSRTVKFLLGYSVLIFCFYWFPLSAFLIEKMIGDTYWRVIWLLPLFPVIAYAFTEILSRFKDKKWMFVLCSLLLIGLVALAGKDYWSREYLFSYGNRQKVPDAVAFICETLHEDAGEQEIMVAVDNRYAPYMRVYDASIRMPFGRMGRGALDKKAKKLYREMLAKVPDGAVVGSLAKAEKCNYLVVRIYDDAGQASFTEAGYVQIAESGVYKILRLEEMDQ